MTQLKESTMRAIYPYWKENSYRGINTSIGVHTYIYGTGTGSIGKFKEAMRETGRNFRVLAQKERVLQYSRMRSIELKYEVLS
ncbi:hypothetical protein ACQRBF_05790 [Peptoniphilaceae bacterium SGI.131]